MKNEDFKCTQCGNSDLHVFNVPHSEIKSKVFYLIVTIISAISTFAWSVSLVRFLAGFKSLKYIWNSVFAGNGVTDKLVFNVLGFLISLALLLVFIAFLDRPTYKIKNVTEYYCSVCGRQAPVEEINKKNGEATQV